MITIKQIMETFPDNHILIKNDATGCQVSSGITMTSKEMIHILSEEILNRKVDRYETKKFIDGTFTVIHILSNDLPDRDSDQRETKEIDDYTSTIIPMPF